MLSFGLGQKSFRGCQLALHVQHELEVFPPAFIPQPRDAGGFAGLFDPALQGPGAIEPTGVHGQCAFGILQRAEPCSVKRCERDQQRSEAIRRHDWERVDTLQSALDRVGVFEPYIMHSFGEQAQPMRFHAQLVCDLATVVEIAERVLHALEWRAANGGRPEEPA